MATKKGRVIHKIASLHHDLKLIFDSCKEAYGPASPACEMMGDGTKLSAIIDFMAVAEFNSLSMTYAETQALQRLSMMGLGRVSQERGIPVTPRNLLVGFHRGQFNFLESRGLDRAHGV